MSAALLALRKFFKLFVDDGSFAIALIVWSTAAGYLLSRLPAAATWAGPILFLGYLAILGENLHRTARKR